MYIYTPGSGEPGPRFLTGGPGAAPGGVASKNGWVYMRVQGGFDLHSRVFPCVVTKQLLVSKNGLRERLRVCRGEARNQLRGLKEGGSARRGAGPCLSADLTSHAVKRTLHPVVGFENGEACAPRRAKRCGDGQGKRVLRRFDNPRLSVL